MVDFVANTGYNDSKRVNIFYFSDYHGNVPAYRKLQSASDEFDRRHKDTENLKLCGGDLTAGDDAKRNVLLYRILKKMNIDASAVGNHEWDNKTNFYNKFDKLYNDAPNLLFTNYLSCNTDAPENSKYKTEGLFQSKIIKKNNEKFGVIGATTFDDYEFEYCKIDDFEHTKKDIEEEIQTLKKIDPSLNKFILVSHLGVKADKEIAKSVSDIDIIIGGHSHTLINGVKPGENLFMSPKNEPVLIVQAGNEKTFGELSVSFDKNGRIELSKGDEPVNKIGYNKDYPENPKVKELEDKIFSKSDFLGYLAKDIRPDNPLLEENPLGNLNTDAIRKKTKSDIALLNAGGFRAYMNAGPIYEKDLEYCLPFKNDVVKIRCTGKDIADIIRLGVDSTKNENVNPGLYQVSGLRYTVTADSKVKNLYTVDEKGKKNKEIIDDKGNLVPDGANEKFDVAMTDFMIVQMAQRGVLREFVIKDDGKMKVDKKFIIKKYDKQRDMLEDYLKDDFARKNKPVDVDTGRITFERNQKPSNANFLSLVSKSRV